MSTVGESFEGVSCCNDVRGYMDATVCLGGVCPLALAEFVLNLDSKYKKTYHCKHSNIQINK